MHRLSLIITLIYCQSGCAQQPQQVKHNSIRISSDFDCGSIGKLVESPANVLRGNTLHWKHRTSSDDQYYWFYFKLGHVQHKLVTIKLENLSGIYRGQPHLIYTQGTKPVYSYDRKNWQRIEDVFYDTTLHTLTFRNLFEKDSVWVAYAHPYTYSMHTDFLASFLHNSPYLEMDTIGRSVKQRPIELITITDPAIPDDMKKIVLITTLQHAGEYIGGFFVEGMISFLLSKDSAAIAARKNFIYKIVPMMNPDGIFSGMTRLNADYEDLNQEWDDDFSDTLHRPTEPEVACVKKWLRSWIHSGRRIDIALDVHSQGQQGELNILHVPPGILTGLAEKLDAYWPVERIEMQFSGSANDCLVNEFHVAAGTFEITQSSVNGGAYLTIDDYRRYGSGTIKGINNYLFPAKSTK